MLQFRAQFLCIFSTSADFCSIKIATYDLKMPLDRHGCNF